MAKVLRVREKLVGLLFVSGIVALVIFVLVGGILSEAATRDQVSKTTDASPKNKPGSITGRITIQGKPASGLVVTLQPRHNHLVDKAIATASTDEEGRYHFSDIFPGHYWIKILGREYVTARGFQYDGPGRDVSLSDGGLVDDGDIELIRGGVVSGRIRASDGATVPNEHVFVTAVNGRGQMYLQGSDGEPFKTDANGYYRIYGVPPGRYLVGVGVDIPRVTGEVRDRDDFGMTGTVGADHYYAETFNPGISDKSQAQVLEVTEGSELSDIDITVGRRFRAFTVSGRVVDTETGAPISSCYIELGHNVGGGYRSSYGLGGPSDTDSEGRFSLNGLVPGAFYVNAQYVEPTESYSTPVAFEVKDQDVEGLEIKAQRGVRLRGTVSVVGAKIAGDIESKISLLKLQTSETRGGSTSPLHREGIVGRDGSFEIVGLRPGNFELSIGSSDVSEYFSLVRVEYSSDDKSAPTTIAVQDRDRAFVTVGKAGLKGVRVVLAYKNGRIKIHVDIENGKLPAGVRLIAWIGNDHWTTMPELDSNGDFIEEGLSPGEYQVEIGDGSTRFTGKKIVKVANNGEAQVSFIIDAGKIKGRN